MLRRRRPAALPTTRQPIGAHQVTTLVGNPDTPVIQRERGLRHVIGAGLQGHAGTAYGYDKGDPANSFETVVQTARQPTAALAGVGRIADAVQMQAPMQITDIAMSDPALDPFQELLWNRIAR
jgi:hypothetical protein